MSEQRSLWPQSLLGWQASCERLPPASRAVVEQAVWMVALCCAVVCCVIYSCSGPSINNAAVFASRTYYGNNISATDTILSILPILGVPVMYVKRFQRRYSGQTAPHSIALTCKTVEVRTYIHFSRYPGTMTVYFKVLLLLDVRLLLLLSRNSYLCPELLSTNNVPRQALPVDRNIITF